RRAELLQDASGQAVAEELAGKVDHPGRRYLARGLYAPQLERYVRHVGKERLVVKSFLHLVEDPHRLVSDVLQRMGLAAMPKEHPAFSVRSNKRSYAAPIDPTLAEELYHFYERDGVAVNELLGTPITFTGPRATQAVK
ncbi:MAG TPA: hypothetical protein PK760_14550, partial [Flavobacteriales bacterium]|nr:hypothetical protein [Flavobacteriales bacterium]